MPGGARISLAYRSQPVGLPTGKVLHMVEIRLFGPLRVTNEGASDVALSSAREGALLALLAINNERTLTSDELIDTVWGDELPADPKHALQSAMSRLRKTEYQWDGNLE